MDDYQILSLLQRSRQIYETQKIGRAINESRIDRSEGPKCPSCGGVMDGEFRKCRHCASDVAWVHGVPCLPEHESELVDHFEQLELESHRITQRVLAAAGDTPDECPGRHCNSVKPGANYRLVTADQEPRLLEIADRWRRSFEQHGQCPYCVKMDRKERIQLIIVYSICAILAVATLVAWGAYVKLSTPKKPKNNQPVVMNQYTSPATSYGRHRSMIGTVRS